VIAVATIEGYDIAGLFVIEDGTVKTPVYSDPIVLEIDAPQHLTGEGPCLDAMIRRVVFYAADLDGELRWARFAPAAVSAGIRSMLALPVADATRLGAIRLYARCLTAFGVVDRARAAILASLASQALTSAR
jgi:GAF domain-containing protein